MKLMISILAFSFIWISKEANGQGWQSAKLIKSSNGTSYGATVAADRVGNFFLGASYSGSGIFIDSLFLPGVSNQDYIVVAKFNSLGILRWATTSYSAGTGNLTKMVCDKFGNLIIMGICQAPFSWQGHTISDTLNPNKYFLTKIDSNGNLIWLKSVADINNNVAPSVPPIYGGITVDENGNIYVTGGLVDTVNNIEGHLTRSNGGAEIFLNKYDVMGNLIWTRVVGGNMDDLAYNITSTKSGNIYISGTFKSDSLSFDTTVLHSTGLGIGLGNVFVAKYDSSGTVIWARSSCGNGVCNGVATDIGENVYITGLCDSIRFDTFKVVHSGSAPLDMTFITKFNAAGNVNWVKKIDNTGPTTSDAIAVDGCNSLWLAVDISGPILVPNDMPSMIVHYAPNGTLLETATIQSAYGNRQIALDPAGNIYMASDVWPLMNYGPRYFYVGPSSYYITNNAMDGYVAKFVPAAIFRDSIFLHSDTAFCSSSPKTLVAPPGYLAYEWSDYLWGNTRSVDDAGPFVLYGYPESCSVPVLVDTFSIRIDSLHTFSLGNDTLSCVPFYLLAPFTPGSYLWQDSSTTDSYFVAATGTYILTERELTCSFTDTVNVVIDSTPCAEPRRPLLPKAFTPNGDGVNDIIRPFFDNSTFVIDYSFTVYDRYGKRVFRTTDPSSGWDGTINNQKAESGVYMYDIKYKTKDSKSFANVVGNITLIR